jgi:hypothetical protein
VRDDLSGEWQLPPPASLAGDDEMRALPCRPNGTRPSATISAWREGTRIYLALGGDLEGLDAGRMTALPGDVMHEQTGTLIEVDESQHFTSFRLATLDLSTRTASRSALPLPRTAAMQNVAGVLGRLLPNQGCASVRCRRQAEAARLTMTRDLATPAMGRPPLIRLEAAERDAADAYRRHRDELLAALG